MQASVPPGDPAALLRRFSDAAAGRGFASVRYGEVSGHPLLAFTKRTPGVRPRVYLSAGIHGDEPASTLALLHLFEAGVFDARATWFICPLLNPAGLVRGVRENAEGVDLNRDYQAVRSAEVRAHIGWLGSQPNFDLSICLHEDWESTGYYLYERDVVGRPGLAESVLAAAARFLPIEPSETIDGFEARGGIIRPSFDLADRGLWPESIYLHFEHHTRLHYTLESPSKLPLELRIAAHRAAVGVILGSGSNFGPLR